MLSKGETGKSQPVWWNAGMTCSAKRRMERIVCSLVSVPKKKEPTK
jgi:hypothetical protein